MRIPFLFGAIGPSRWRARASVLALVLLLLAPFAVTQAQVQEVSGVVVDADNDEPLPYARVRIPGTGYGAYTDGEGAFTFKFKGELPITLQADYTGYDSAQVQVSSLAQPVRLALKLEGATSQTVEITGSRISEKMMENPLTVETMDLTAIEQTPAANFYDGLGALKGVDVTTASMGFKVINTRGFNSTQPVRSLQLIDGVDNMAPGLNFSLGNFMGVSELDIQSVELVVGASSAQYGPAAFNGVVNMTTKSPFLHQGLSVMTKVGERGLFDGALRWAKAFKNKKDRQVLGVKLNIAYMRANDWEAANTDPTFQAVSGQSVNRLLREQAYIGGAPRNTLPIYGRFNPGGYDAINIYGDENSFNLADDIGRRDFPGFGFVYRSGYAEENLVDYNTQSIKLNGVLHYRPTDKLELIYGYNFGTGTTVLQGDNRYSLKGLQFQQHKLELRGQDVLSPDDEFFVRAYATLEDAGKSYDAVFTAFRMQDQAAEDSRWFTNYSTVWRRNIVATGRLSPYGFVPDQTSPSQVDSIIANHVPYDSLIAWHNEVRNQLDNQTNSSVISPRLEPGTERFSEEFNRITASEAFEEDGTRFVDRSKLYHVQGQYTWRPGWATWTFGANFRAYRPNSRGTIFSDTLIFDPEAQEQRRRKIGVYEAGGFLGVERRLLQDRLRLNATLRLDKVGPLRLDPTDTLPDNFDPILSPAVSAVYTLKQNHTFRFSFNTALRNPSLQDQHLFYNVGRAILVGNLTGVDTLITTESLNDYFATLNPSVLEFQDIDPVRPERVRTVELGYKGRIKDFLYVDANAYFSFYDDFLGFIIGHTDPSNPTGEFTTYRVSANAQDRVFTQGFSLGVNYYFKQYYALVGNYSFNRLNKAGSDDPIIPAFNTPEHKFNIGLNGRDIPLTLGNLRIENLGFNVNFRWVQGYLFEGSPQFTGFIDDYTTLDAQVNYRHDPWNTTFKLGASNLLNIPFIQAYGGPEIGRLGYFQVTLDID